MWGLWSDRGPEIALWLLWSVVVVDLHGLLGP